MIKMAKHEDHEGMQAIISCDDRVSRDNATLGWVIS